MLNDGGYEVNQTLSLRKHNNKFLDFRVSARLKSNEILYGFVHMHDDIENTLVIVVDLTDYQKCIH